MRRPVSKQRHGAGPIPFRHDGAPRQAPQQSPPAAAAEEILCALEGMSRRIDDLARELNCLGYFDDGDDRPRAA